MRDWWMEHRWNVIVVAGAVFGTIFVALMLLAMMALGGVWGPGWLGDLVDSVVG